MKVQNTTIQNRSKNARLNLEHVIPHHCIDNPEIVKFLQDLIQLNVAKDELLFSIGCHLTKGNENLALKKFKSEYKFAILNIRNIPNNCFDLLGSAYQYLNSKKENLKQGSFYTGEQISLDFVSDLDFSSNQTIFDPSCGSGAFLFRSNALANQIFGVDSDPIAIMIAKFNYFLKFPTAKAPNLFCMDFFDWIAQNPDKKFSYVVGNPPYGANLDISKMEGSCVTSGESFSYFIESGYKLVERDGTLRFLVPEALLNVKRHSDIREFILDRTNLRRIKRYSNKFSGVMSDTYQIELDRGLCERIVFEVEEKIDISKTVFRNLKNQIFVPLNQTDLRIIDKVMLNQRFNLANSTFGLGVVTGDNKSKLFTKKVVGSEHIYTGKEVQKYSLSSPKNFLFFDRDALQQVAPDFIYRTRQKLVYKTINKRLKFALDESKSLTSNSANILIPDIPGYEIETVLAFLNSDIYSYLYMVLFGFVNKVGKEHLMALPFPAISEEVNKMISQECRGVIETGNDRNLQVLIHEGVFKLLPSEVEYIRKKIA
jgi:hypothetical protein